MIINFLKLYRLDVAILVILIYFFGGVYSFGISAINLHNFLIVFLISFISVNFIYSLNSWFDADVDKINKPNRPIPSGLITEKQALIYSIFLGIISVIYPIILFWNSNIKFLLFIFPLFGFLYSNKFFNFKKKKYLAFISLVLCLCNVFVIGFLNNTGTFSIDSILLFLIFFLFCFCTIPLKDFTDVIGDKKNNIENWFDVKNKNKKIFFIIFLLEALLVICFLLENNFFKNLFSIYIYSELFLFFIFYILKLNLNKFYNTLLLVFLIDGIVFLCTLF